MRIVCFWMVMLLSAGCASKESQFTVLGAKWDGDTDLEVLIKQEQYTRKCRFGGHGCTTKTLSTKIYVVNIPAQEQVYSLAYLTSRWRFLYDIQEQFPYRQYFVGEHFIGEVKGWNTLTRCDFNPSKSTCIQQPSVEAPATTIGPKLVIGNEGRRVLWHGQLLSLNGDPDIQLSARPGYIKYVSQVDKAFSVSNGMRIPHYLLEGRYVVATARFNSPEQPLIALVYDADLDTINAIDWPLARQQENVAIQHVLSHVGQLFFWAHLVDYEGYKQVLDKHVLYSNTAKSIVPLQNFSARTTSLAPLWSDKDMQLLFLDWHDGLKVVARPIVLPIKGSAAQ